MNTSAPKMSTTRLPRFIVLKARSTHQYLIHHPDKEENREDTLQFSGTDFTSLSAKFEVVPSTMGDEYVHIKCCSNNKYWVNRGGDLVTASATEIGEKHSSICTVFKLNFHQAEGSEDIIMLTKLINPKSVMISDSLPHKLCVGYVSQGNHNNIHVTAHHYIHNADHLIFTDWDTLPILPKYFALKGDNDKYLEATTATGELAFKYLAAFEVPALVALSDTAAFMEVLKDPKQVFIPRVYLGFNSSDKGEEKVGNEVFTYIDGTVRIKNNSTGQFWRCRTEWIFADSQDETNLDRNTLFTVHKFGDKIALKCVGNDKFCMRVEDYYNYLKASTSGIPTTTMFTVEELVNNKRISNVRYDEVNKRIEKEEKENACEADYNNNTSAPMTTEVKFEYTEEVGHTWTTTNSLKKSVEIGITAKVPYLEGVTVKLGVEQTTTSEESKTSMKKIVQTFTKTITVPPYKKVTASLSLSKVTCELPYSYRLSETLPGGKVVSTDMYDGVYNWVKTSIKFGAHETAASDPK